jgi:hypothetical protein
LGDPSGFAAEPVSLGGESLPVGKNERSPSLSRSAAHSPQPWNPQAWVQPWATLLGSPPSHLCRSTESHSLLARERRSHLSFPVARAVVARGALPATLEPATFGDPSGIAAEPFVSLDGESLPVGTTSVDFIYRFQLPEPCRSAAHSPSSSLCRSAAQSLPVGTTSVVLIDRFQLPES